MKSTSSTSSETGHPSQVLRTESQNVKNDNDNDNDNPSVTVDVAAMGDFAAGAEESWWKKAPLSEVVKTLIVNPQNSDGEKIKNVFVVDENAVAKFCSLRKIDRDSDIDFIAALQDERTRRYEDLEATLPPKPSVDPAAAFNSAPSTHPATSSWMSQRLANVHDTLVAHKRAFAIVASLATGAVVATAAAYLYLTTIGETAPGEYFAENRLYETRSVNYSRGEELRRTNQTARSYETPAAFERSMQLLADHAWHYPNERAFEPRKSPLDFDVTREFAINGPKTKGTTTVTRFNLTNPVPVLMGAERRGLEWLPPVVVSASAAFTLACMLIVYNVIMRKLN